MRFEHELRGRRAGQAMRIPAEPAVAAPAPVPVPEAPRTAPPVPVPEAPRTPPDTPPETAPDVVASLRAELATRGRDDAALRARVIDAESRLAARVVLERRTRAALADLRTELRSLGGELAKERTLRVDAERRAAALERELRDQRVVSLRAYEAIAELREGLVALAAEAAAERVAAAEPEPEPAAEPEPAPVPAAESAPAPVAQPPAPAPMAGPAPAREPEAEPTPTAAVEPARLNDALTRLRETIAPQDAPAAPSAALVRTPSMHEALTRPSVERAFRTMARTDLDAAGRLLLELLPLQRVVYPHAIAYDLVLAPDRCVWVSVPDGTPSIEVQTAPRPREEVDFQVIGQPARIARLLTAGRLRRIFGRRGARVRGRKQGVAALASLLGAPLDLGALHRAGVRPDPLIALGLLAAMVDPAWTATERFTMAHATPGASRTYLIVNEGRPLTATRIAPQSGPSTTLHCATDDLLAALAGEPVPGVRVDGEVGAFLSLRKWIKRAQSE